MTRVLIYTQKQLLALCLCMLIALAFVSGCSKGDDNPGETSDPEQDFAVSVKVAPVIRSGIRSTIHAVGTVKALNQATISAKIPGKVEKILVDEGTEVSAGQTLLYLEKTDLMLTVRQAKAAVGMAEANLSKATTAWERAQELLEKGIASKEQYDFAKSGFEVAEASVTQAKADYGLATHQLENADVTTLFGGTVLQKFVDIGERVAPGQPLFEVAQIDPVEIEVGVSDRRFSELELGQPSTVMVDGYPDLPFKGEVKMIQPIIDPATRTFKITIGVANPEELLKPGMFARVEIEIDYHPDALVMPKAATLEEEGKYFAVAVRDNRAHRAEIVLGFRDGDRIEVLSGLSEGDQVVLEGAYALAQDAPLQISGE